MRVIVQVLNGLRTKKKWLFAALKFFQDKLFFAALSNWNEGKKSTASQVSTFVVKIVFFFSIEMEKYGRYVTYFL